MSDAAEQEKADLHIVICDAINDVESARVGASIKEAVAGRSRRQVISHQLAVAGPRNRRSTHDSVRLISYCTLYRADFTSI